MRTKLEIETLFGDRSGLDQARSFFLVGVGGAGMSGIARLLLAKGCKVKGSDSTPTALTEELSRLGVDVHIGHSGAGIEAGDAVVFSDAIDLKCSPEYARAQELGVHVYRRSQALGWLLQGLKVIAVTGTHGKTTTTGMVAAGLRAAGMDPTIVVGAEVPELGSAVVVGKHPWAVVEACEAYDSFHDLDPDVVVLTNLELDHVDFHGDYQSLLASVMRFVRRIPFKGALIHSTQRGAAEAAALLGRNQKAYDETTFGQLAPGLVLSTPGSHNLSNAAAALLACIEAGADPALAAAGIAKFQGAERRLQEVCTDTLAGREDEPTVTVVDDYAHHPTEIAASIAALRERYLGRRLVVVFQPHLYSRTKDQYEAFASALSAADLVVMTDIYPAREEPLPGVSSLRIVEALTCPFAYVPSRHLLPREVRRLSEPGDVVVGMGAGNISDFVPAFVNEMARGRVRRVAVIAGGDSPEREVSLHSGRAVLGALQRLGYDAYLLDIADLLLGKGDLSQLTSDKRPDLCFLAVHGVRSEDGALQGLLECAHVPYTGSGVLANALAMDKEMTKQALARENIPIAKGVLVREGDDLPQWPAPLVVKPNAQGSTVGLTFVKQDSEVGAAAEKAFVYGGEVLVEEFLEGPEITVPCLGDRALAPIEIVAGSGEYDFATKYTPGEATKHCPARISDEDTRKAQEHAVKAVRALGCKGVTRTDMIVTSRGPVVLEVNTLPGMTGTSLVAISAQNAGMTFDDLVEWMVRDATHQKA